MTTARRTTLRSAATLVLATSMLAGGTAHADQLPLSRGWEAGIGLRTTFVRSAGYDPYSTRDDLVQLSLEARRVVWFKNRLQLVYGVAWDWGRSSATAREGRTEMGAHRLGMIVEARYRLHPLLAVHARFVPSVQYDWERLTDPSGALTGTGLVSWNDDHWALAVDGAAGASARLLQFESERGEELSVWFRAEGGYGLAPSRAVTLRAALPEGDPRQTGPVDMPSLALRGGFFRLALLLAY